MDQTASWIATAATIIAACFTASNLGSRITGIGFIIFTIGSIAWFTLGYLTDQPALIWTNAVMTALNLFESIAGSVARRSSRPALPRLRRRASRHRAKIFSRRPASAASRLVGKDGEPLGTTVDAMLSCNGGALAISSLRKAGSPAWAKPSAGGLALCRRGRRDVKTNSPPESFERLPELQADNWPGR
jgi:hypothetical protein